MAFFKGNIFITSNVNIIYNTPLNGTTKIISLDEDNILADHESIIKGVCLLPPIEAKIAEADGNEQLYDVIYSNHLLSKFQYDFLAALLSYLFKVGDLILFLPELEFTNTTDKLVEHIYNRFGIHIGQIDQKDPIKNCCRYDERCLPIWINMMYLVGGITSYDYLYLYPVDAELISNDVIEKLIKEINPYGKTIQEQVNYINKYRKLLKQKPDLKPAIVNNIRRN